MTCGARDRSICCCLIYNSHAQVAFPWLMPGSYGKGVLPSSSEIGDGRQPKQFFPAMGLTQMHQNPHYPYTIYNRNSYMKRQSGHLGPFFGFFPNFFHGIPTTTTSPTTTSPTTTTKAAPTRLPISCTKQSKQKLYLKVGY